MQRAARARCLLSDSEESPPLETTPRLAQTVRQRALWSPLSPGSGRGSPDRPTQRLRTLVSCSAYALLTLAMLAVFVPRGACAAQIEFTRSRTVPRRHVLPITNRQVEEGARVARSSTAGGAMVDSSLLETDSSHSAASRATFSFDTDSYSDGIDDTPSLFDGSPVGEAARSLAKHSANSATLQPADGTRGTLAGLNLPSRQLATDLLPSLLSFAFGGSSSSPHGHDSGRASLLEGGPRCDQASDEIRANLGNKLRVQVNMVACCNRCGR